ncbi:cysteine-rich venom protein VAR5-like, partial [Saccoglossus kowalevskii]
MKSSIIFLTALYSIVPATLCMSVSRHVADLEPQFLLEVHNSLRRTIGLQWGNGDFHISDMKKLEWDTELAKQASEFAICENVGNYRKVDLGSYDGFIDEAQPRETGRNIAFAVNTSIREIIEGWFNQREYYNYEWQSCKPLDKRCDDFIQLAWAEASRLGCSVNPSCVHDGIMGIFLVCIYDVGSTPFEQPFQLGPVCSKCGASAGFCEEGLCVNDCMNSVSCECLKTCNHPGVGEGVLDVTTCTCQCNFGMGFDCEDKCENPQFYEDWSFCKEIDTSENCDTMMEMQIEYCPANCDYGC